VRDAQVIMLLQPAGAGTPFRSIPRFAQLLSRIDKIIRLRCRPNG
jgi:hypothetical protein